MQQLLRILSETLKLTLQQLWSNKLRTFLSLFGITVGIFSIISILTAVDAMKNNINQSISSMGDNVLFINKWAWSLEGPTDWWKYYRRPNVKVDDARFIQDNSKLAEYVTFELNTREQIELAYKDKKTLQAYMSAVTANYAQVFDINLAQGRFLSNMEINNGLDVCVIGGVLAEKLFKDVDNPIGLSIKFNGKKLTVLGVIEKKGQDLIGFNFDKAIIIPLQFYENNFSYSENMVDKTVEVKTKANTTLDALKDEIVGLMRMAHKLRPKQDDNFSINNLSVIAKGFDEMFNSLNIAKWLIGLFSLIVGGFGIANIMFVSVSERKPIIGIKKALGARKSDILLEFLLEAIFLCFMGAIIGIIIVYFLCIVLTDATGMDFKPTAINIAIGFIIAFVLGILSGIIPAYLAATMDPVEAIRSK